jgi:hypothetical protein
MEADLSRASLGERECIWKSEIARSAQCEGTFNGGYEPVQNHGTGWLVKGMRQLQLAQFLSGPVLSRKA